MKPGFPLALPLAALGLLAAGCAMVGGAPARAASPTPGRPACASSAAIPPGLASPGALLLFGEVHGVREFPEFFGEAVCGLASSGAQVTVALELPGGEQASVEAFIASAEPVARERLLASPFWRRAYQDGRSSEAMVGLLSRLRDLRQAGLAIDLLLFDVETPGPDRDAQMAERLSAHLRTHPLARVLVLTGNLHARTAPGAPWDPQWRPMGWFLQRAGAPVVSLDCAGQRGTAWICPSDVAADCGPRAVWASRDPSPGLEPGIEILASPTPEGFRGLYRTGSVTASPPAVAPRATPAP